jgi:hypothetical protein
MREGCWACAAAAVEDADEVDAVVAVGDDVVAVVDVGDGVEVVAVDVGVVLEEVEPEPAGLGLEPGVVVDVLAGVSVPCGLSGN